MSGSADAVGPGVAATALDANGAELAAPEAEADGPDDGWLFLEQPASEQSRLTSTRASW